MRPNLGLAVRAWATPTVMDAAGFMGQKDKGRVSENSGQTLLGQATAWATPTKDEANNVTRESGVMQSLSRDVVRWASPRSNDHKEVGDLSGTPENGYLGRQAFNFDRGGAGSPAPAPTGRSGESLEKQADEGPESALWPVADGVPGRVARVAAIGDAVVPACALEAFRIIEAREARRC